MQRWAEVKGGEIYILFIKWTNCLSISSAEISIKSRSCTDGGYSQSSAIRIRYIAASAGYFLLRVRCFKPHMLPENDGKIQYSRCD
jgi:hypothetical protein